MRLACILACATLAACTAAAEQVHPPDNDIFFPTGAAVSPDQGFLFVSNANSELRWDSGSVAVFDLNLVDQIANDWATNHAQASGCEQDPDRIETLICPMGKEGERKGAPSFILKTAGARLGNFSTDIAIQDLHNGKLRLIVPTRGDPSVAWLDWDGTRLDCNPGAEGFVLCDELHRLSYVHNDPNLALLPDEPFNAFADSRQDFAMVTHLTSGAVTLIDSPRDGEAVIADVNANLFAPDPLTGLRGSTGIAGRMAADGSDTVYVGSRSEDRIQMLTVGRPVNGAAPYMIPGNWFFLDLIGTNAGGSTDTRGMAFSPTGNRLYVVNRKPPSVQVYDTSPTATGFPANHGLGGTDICREASTISVMDVGAGERAYVTCFQDGEIYVIDPSDGSSVEDIITVGRGPYAVVTSPTHKKVYVTNFLEDSIAVIDVSPTSPTRNRVVLRMRASKEQ